MTLISHKNLDKLLDDEVLLRDVLEGVYLAARCFYNLRAVTFYSDPPGGSFTHRQLYWYRNI